MKHPARPGLMVTAALLAAVCAGCGDGDGNGDEDTTEPPTPTATGATTTTAPPTSPPASEGAATVTVRSGDLGRILTDGSGRTLYLFEADTSDRSTCSGGCAAAWPPLITSGKPKAGEGVDAGKLATTTRSDGKTEVVYNGHPLYYYVEDDEPGDTEGQGLDQFGAKWFVLDPAGDKITRAEPDDDQETDQETRPPGY
ncbi:hypothetical protein [Streptomyces sp. XD-27]|uniref:COG4315 family predicted lipoprotein n=1 Tax=Streptomyces sp. XD-27 TaxID=3062779 RepID=UPI0026F426D6|nr:hypothetical protein [Streptomyces sp. XD-27]WKX69097.1 hypothetical protein Q3Y56_03455 [Streptomyces sp. XD-27]